MSPTTGVPATGVPATYTLHYTEAQVRAQVRETRRDAARLTLIAHLVWFGGGLGGLLMAIGMHWAAGPLGLGLGVLLTVWMQRQVGLSAEVDRVVDAARAGDNVLAHPVELVLHPDSLEVRWPDRSVRAAWSWVTLDRTSTHTTVSAGGYLGPLAVVPADHPLARALACVDVLAAPLSHPSDTVPVAHFEHGPIELAAIQEAVGVSPRTFKKLLAGSAALAVASAGAFTIGVPASGVGLLVLSLILGLTGTAEHWTRWLMPPLQAPDRRATETRMGLHEDGWWVGTDQQLSVLQWHPEARLLTTDTHVVLVDRKQVVGIPRSALADPQSFEDAISVHIAEATPTKLGPQRFADDPTVPSGNPYAPPRSQGGPQ